MQRHDEMQSLAAGYALSALEPDEATAFAEHVKSCPDCIELLAEIRALTDALPNTVPQVEPPAALKSRVMAAVRTEASGRSAAPRPTQAPAAPQRWWLSRTFGLGVAAAVLLFALVGTATWAMNLQGRLEASQNRVTTLYEAMTLLAEADQRWEFSGSPIEPEARGILAYSSEQQASMLMVWGLPAQAEEATYVAWAASNGTRQGAGSMRRANGGLWIIVPGSVQDMDSVGITLRGPTGSGIQPTDVIVVSLR